MVQGRSSSFGFARTDRPDGARRRQGAPLRILVIGPFRGNRDAQEAPAPTPEDIRPVGVDRFDRLIAELAPAVDLAFEHPRRMPVQLVFHSLADFHPDGLAARDPVLRRLRAIEDRLRDPPRFAQAAAELTAMLGTARGPIATRDQAAARPPPQTPETDAETLERLFGTKAGAVAQASKSALIDEMIRRLVTPAGAAGADAGPDPGPCLEAADAVAAERLCDLLHHPDLQRLEAAWRSLHGLVSQIDGEEPPEVFLLGLEPCQLAQAVATGGGRPLLAQLLSATSAIAPDAAPWAFIVGDYRFGPDDIDLLSRLGDICREAGVGFLAGADPLLLGCSDLTTRPDPQDWTGLAVDAARALSALRSSPAAQFIGLALPRILLRLPYGEETDPCERFAFEEIRGAPVHGDFLWGNPAFLCARVLAAADRATQGRRLYGDIGELPVYIDRSGTEPRMQPCAEVYLSEAAGRAIAQAGLIPAYSYQRQDMVRLGPIQTLAREPIF